MNTIAPGITRVPAIRRDRDNAFLIDGYDGLTLVDAGWASTRHAAPRAS